MKMWKRRIKLVSGYCGNERELVVAGRPMLGKASELVVAGRPMLTLEVENEACERLVSRLWWYICYRGTLLREGTPPVPAFALGNEVK